MSAPLLSRIRRQERDMMKINYAWQEGRRGVDSGGGGGGAFSLYNILPQSFLFLARNGESVVMEKWPAEKGAASRSRARQTRDGEKRDLCGGGGQAKRKIHQRIWDQDAITVYRDQLIGIPCVFIYILSTLSSRGDTIF